jgi:hypothetical protein
MGDKAIKTKTDLYAMLAVAVRNTQRQPVRITQLALERETRPALKRTAKIKRVRR